MIIGMIKGHPTKNRMARQANEHQRTRRLLLHVVAELQAPERCASRRSPEQTLKTMAE
jgi:hypothetical protein